MTPARAKAAALETEREPPDYLPIAEHGIIGDLHSIALVGSDGTIDWYCPGRFDAPSVFASILDRHKGGYFRISPSCAEWSTKQLYIPDTNVLVTRFFTPGGVTEIRDFMPIEGKRLGMHRHRLVRRVVQVRGAAVLKRGSAHSPATSAIAATIFGWAPHRQRLPLIPSRIASRSRGLSSSNARPDMICPGVQ